VPRASHKSYSTGGIRLFDSKYVGIFHTHMECVAFVKGVEVVLHYMLKVKDVKSPKALLTTSLRRLGSTGNPLKLPRGHVANCLALSCGRSMTACKP
jgi:hypothetical protein